MYTFIANPNARSGRGILLWKQIEKILLEKDLPGCLAEAFYETDGIPTVLLIRLLSSEEMVL